MNRRTFTAACGLALAAPSMALAGPPPAASDAAPSAAALHASRFSRPLFAAYRGEEFRLSGIGIASATIRLHRIVRESVAGPVEQFALHFEPVRGELPAVHGLFLLEHPQGGKIALSLQPVEADGAVRSLTASFSLIG